MASAAPSRRDGEFMNQFANRIYRYVVRHDGGTAPRPFDGVCSLAICKPRIRRSARPGDWIIGFRSGRQGEVLYVMYVDEVLALGEYWLDKRFANRKPGASVFPDNIYKPATNGGLIQVPNKVHSQGNVATDTSGRNVLLAKRFWYFGRNAVRLPECLWHLIHSGIGHTVHKNRRRDDVEQIERWLAAWKPGIHGDPIDAPATSAVPEYPSVLAVDARGCGPRKRSRCG